MTDENRALAEQLVAEIKAQVDQGKKVNKSEVMRELWKLGYTVGEISKALGVVYSFVYGVIDRTGAEIRSNTSETTTSDHIRGMWDTGMDVGAISKALNINYSWAFTVVKKYRNSGKSNRKLVDGTWVMKVV